MVPDKHTGGQSLMLLILWRILIPDSPVLIDRQLTTPTGVADQGPWGLYGSPACLSNVSPTHGYLWLSFWGSGCLRNPLPSYVGLVSQLPLQQLLQGMQMVPPVALPRGWATERIWNEVR